VSAFKAESLLAPLPARSSSVSRLRPGAAVTLAAEKKLVDIFVDLNLVDIFVDLNMVEKGIEKAVLRALVLLPIDCLEETTFPKGQFS
jgi:precorrin isomerase